MTLSALKFIGLALCAVVLGVLSASFATALIGPGVGGYSSHGSNGFLAVKGVVRVTEDEIPGHISHILGRQ